MDNRKPTHINPMFRIITYFKPYILHLCLILLCYLAIAGLNLAWPYLNGTVLTDKILGRDSEYLTEWGLGSDQFMLGLGLVVLAMLGTKLLSLLFQMVQGILSASIVPNVVAQL